MKKRNKTITAIILFIIYSVCGFIILPKMSAHYFESDISEFEDSVLVLAISILTSIILTLTFVLDPNKFKLSVWKKIDHILLLVFMGYLIFNMVKYTVPIIGLVINKTNYSETFSKEFIITRKDHLGNNQYVYCRYLEKVNQGKMDRLYVGKEHYSKLKENHLITVDFKKGILSIPFDPIIAE